MMTALQSHLLTGEREGGREGGGGGTGSWVVSRQVTRGDEVRLPTTYQPLPSHHVWCLLGCGVCFGVVSTLVLCGARGRNISRLLQNFL